MTIEMPQTQRTRGVEDGNEATFFAEGICDVTPNEAGSAPWAAPWEQCYPLIVVAVAEHPMQPADADDIVQEIFLVVRRHPPALRGARPGGRLRSWCARAARWKVANLRRWQRRHGAVDVDELRGSGQEPTAPAEDAAEREEDECCLERVLEALEQLPGGRDGIHAQVVLLHYQEEQTVPEIAKALGKTPGQITGYLRRALAKLRRAPGVDP